MDEIDAYQKNQRVFLRGIDTSLQKNPYRMNADELNALECELNKAGALLGGIAVLVEWGQPFGGPVSAVKYHLAAEIIDLVDTYEKSGLKGICPKAGLVISYDWIDKQRKRIETVNRRGKTKADIGEYMNFALHTQF